jgi:hypothetical protein
MDELEQIKNDIAEIKERNARVETDKAWEVSWIRRLFIALITYLGASLWLLLINDDNILLKAVIPTAGYLLSTISIPILKKLWQRG